MLTYICTWRTSSPIHVTILGLANDDRKSNYLQAAEDAACTGAAAVSVAASLSDR